MSAILKTLHEIDSNPYRNCPCAAPIAKFVETGDPKSLAKKSGKNCHVYYLHDVLNVVAPPEAMQEEDRRLLEALARLGLHRMVFSWVAQALCNHPRSNEDYHAIGRAAYGWGELPIDEVAGETASCCGDRLLAGGEPTSAGRFLLSLDEQQLDRLIDSPNHSSYLVDLLLKAAPERVRSRAGKFITPPSFENDKKTGTWFDPHAALALVKADPKRYKKLVEAAYKELEDPQKRYYAALGLISFDAKYRDDARRACVELITLTPEMRKIGGRDFYWNPPYNLSEWLINEFGVDALDDILAFMTNVNNVWWIAFAVDKAVARLGPAARPVVLAAAACRNTSSISYGASSASLKAAAQLVEWNDPADEEPIRDAILANFEADDAKIVTQAINLVARWKPALLMAELWQLLGHSAKSVRESAARSLGRIGDEVVPRAGELLCGKKATARAAAVTLLRTAQTPEAVRLLEARLDEEPDDEVRDQILLSLDSVWEAQGKKLSRADVAERVKRAEPKLADALPAWLEVSSLPALHDSKGKPLDEQTVRYLLYRQSRAKEMRADIEAKPLYGFIDRSKSGDFALAVLRAFLSSGKKIEASDRWAMAVAGLLGDDRVVPVINSQIREWVDSNRGKLAEYAAQALALLGTDAALCLVDSLSIKYRSKQKNIGKAAAESFIEAAERLGITPDELGDRVVPWLGFEPGKPRVIDAGKKQIEVRVSPDLKFEFFDLEKKKKIASLPGGVPAETKAEFKDLGATLREVVKGQLLRLENLMVRQFRWPVARWRELFLEHPILFPFAQRLVWGAYDEGGQLTECFRALEDRTLTDENDETVTLAPCGSIGIVHPLELDEAARDAWRRHLSDYNVESPFAQMERSVIRPSAEEATWKKSQTLRGTSLNALTFKSRSEKLGWQRGSVIDAGCIEFYVKSFPGAGADAFLGLDGMFIGVGVDDKVTLGDLFFVRSGSVEIGSYTYDEPRKNEDERLLAFGNVPAIVYSEVIGDLKKIAGTGKEEDE